MSITPTQRLAMVAFIVFVGAMSGYAWLVTSIVADGEARDTARGEQQRRVAAAQREDVLVQARGRVESLERELAEYLVDAENPTPFLTRIESMGQDVGVELSVSSIVRDDERIDGNRMLRVVLLVEGSYDSLFRLVQLLETMPYAAVLDRVAIALSGEGEVWEGQIHLRVAGLPDNV